MAYSYNNRSSYGGGGFSTPTKSYYESSTPTRYTGGNTSGGGYSTGYGDSTPQSARGSRYSVEGIYGVTPTPGQRPTTARRAATPTTGSRTSAWDSPNKGSYTTGSLAYGRGDSYYGSNGATSAGGGGSVRKNLNSELSLAQERYSTRNSLAAMHPNNTANSAQRTTNATTTATSLDYGNNSGYGISGYFNPSMGSSTTPTSASIRRPASPSGDRTSAWKPTSNATQYSSYTPESSSSPGRARRVPSMDKNGFSFLPQPDAADRHKPLIVLDLDETLVYARNGPVNVRPGVRELLRSLHGRAEVAVWTAGERDYAQGVIQRIDTNGTIKHCVYRHPRWWTGQPGYTKDLKLLGRNVDRVLLVDNTPDCHKDYPWNGLLVEDFTGRSDHELTGVRQTIEFILEADPQESIPDIMSQCPYVCRRRIPLDGYGASDLWTLVDSSGDYSPGRSSRVNRDLSQGRASSTGRSSAGSAYWRRY